MRQELWEFSILQDNSEGKCCLPIQPTYSPSLVSSQNLPASKAFPNSNYFFLQASRFVFNGGFLQKREVELLDLVVLMICWTG